MLYFASGFRVTVSFQILRSLMRILLLPNQILNYGKKVFLHEPEGAEKGVLAAL